MTQDTASHGEDVEQLRARFMEFRKTHAVRSRLPEELWAAAAKAARRDGIEVTARVLGVDRPSLQKWTDRFESLGQAQQRKAPVRRRARKRVSAAPAFVELLAETTAATSCLVEVESPKGGKLRLELKTIRAHELAELIRAFVA
jgi:DNA-binding MarR family transcriptional regulator